MPEALPGLRLRGVIVAGVLIVLAFLGGFGAWAVLAPLKGAAVASGVVVVDGKRKTVRHLEGGIVESFAVREGTAVQAGQVLMRLDGTRAAAEAERLRLRHRAAAARKARFAAERDGLDEVRYPPRLRREAAGDARVREILAGQRSLFRARRRARRDERAILQARIEGLRREIAGLQGESEALATQSRLVHEEIDDVAGLLDKGLARKPRLLELRGRAAQLDGTRQSNRARIGRAEQEVAEARMRIRAIDGRRVKEAGEGIDEARSSMFELAERLREAEDVLRRLEVRAPLSGTVVDLRVHTPGGTVDPGQALMDIVPHNERLVVEARIAPKDIEAVEPGLSTQVRLTALDRRYTEPLAGRLTSVSADSLEDSRTGEAYFLGRIVLERSDAAAAAATKLRPGMQAEVMIVTAERSFLDYLLKPFLNSLNRAFTET